LGLARTALLFGILNGVVALWSTYLFRETLGARRVLQAGCVAVLVVLGAGMVGAERITRMAESTLYADQVVFTTTTKYQRIVLTTWRDDMRLFLNGNLQFSSRDEYRYHEALVHPGLASMPHARKVLVLGGGDGMAVREALRHPDVEVTLVELDPEMTRLFSENQTLVSLNGEALRSERVRIINADAFQWLADTDEMFDFVIADFPDPSNYAVGKLYTTAFYRLLGQHLSQDGMISVQSTSPLFARTAYWSIVETLRESGFETWPYHVYVPSFGEWGFVLAGRSGYETPDRLPDGLRFLQASQIPQLFDFPLDMTAVAALPNRLDDQILVRYYEREWSRIAK